MLFTAETVGNPPHYQSKFVLSPRRQALQTEPLTTIATTNDLSVILYHRHWDFELNFGILSKIQVCYTICIHHTCHEVFIVYLDNFHLYGRPMASIQGRSNSNSDGALAGIHCLECPGHLHELVLASFYTWAPAFKSCTLLNPTADSMDFFNLSMTFSGHRTYLL